MSGQSNNQYVLCVSNEGFSASLEPRKIYRQIEDEHADQVGMVRVTDESGEDYLFPAENFVRIDLPDEAANLFGTAA